MRFMFASPSSNCRPHILSMFMTSPMALHMNLLFPNMLHVAFVCSPSRSNVNSTVFVALNGFRKREVHPDELVRPALRDRHAALTDPAVTGPRQAGAGSRRRSVEGVFRRRVELRVGRHFLPPAEVVHLLERSFGRR